MKKIISILLALVIYGIGLATASISQSEAIQYVLSQVTNESLEHSEFWTGVDSDNNWIIFEDPSPGTNWGHTCIIRKVRPDQDAGETISVEQEISNFPPTIELSRISSSYPHRVVAKSAPQFVRPNIPKRDVPKASKQYAVIISGGGNININYQRYWNDCSLIYRLLVNHFNVPSNNIFPLISSGLTGEKDMKDIDHSPYDLDDDGIVDVYAAATKSELKKLFFRLSSIMQPDDHLFIFVTDHGGRDSEYNESTIVLWNNEEMRASEFASLVNRVNCASINCVFGQCYSGGFVDVLKGPDRYLASACAWDEPSYACSNLLYDAFLLQWCNALYERNVLTDMQVQSDVNKNGKVEMSEAFTFAYRNDERSIFSKQFNSIVVGDINLPVVSKYEHPQLFEGNQCLSRELSFDFLPDPHGLFIRDVETDNGVEQTRSFGFNSPDICVRRYDDDVMDFQEPDWRPSIPRDNYINVMVSNKGWKKYEGQSAGKALSLYWTVGAPFSKVSDYLGQNLDLEGVSTGGLISTVRIQDDINPGESEIIQVKFPYVRIPNKYKYKPINIMACIGEFGDELAHLDSSSINESKSSTISEKHYWPLSDFNPIPIVINSFDDKDHIVSLELKDYNQPNFEFFLKCPELFGTDDEIPFDSSSKIENVVLSKGRSYDVQIVRHQKHGGYILNNGIHIQLGISDENSLLCGTYTFYKPHPTPTILDKVNVVVTDQSEDNVRLEATYDNHDEELHFVWLDSCGEKIGEGESYSGSIHQIKNGFLQYDNCESSYLVPIEINYTEPDFQIVVEENCVTISSDLSVPIGTIIEVYEVGACSGVSSVEWNSDIDTISIPLKNGTGLIVTSVIYNGIRKVIDKRQI